MPPPEKSENPTHGSKAGVDLLRNKPQGASQEAPGAPQGDPEPEKAQSPAQRAPTPPAAAQEPAKKWDESVPGGRFEVNGKIVDANGDPVEKKKSAPKVEDE